MAHILFCTLCGSIVGFMVMLLRKRLLGGSPVWFGLRRKLLERDLDMVCIALPKICVDFLALILPLARATLSHIRERRCSAIEGQLPEMMNLMGGALKAGLSFQQSIEMASIEVASPLGDELGRAVAQMKLGRSVEDALNLLGERVPSESVELMVRSIAVLRRSGGNMIEMFGLLTQTIEGREKVSEKIRVLTAQGIFQGMILLAMPWALCAVLYVMTPEYIEPLISTRLGIAFLLLAILFELVGALWLRKVVIVKV